MVRGKKRNSKMYKAKDRNKCMASDSSHSTGKYKVSDTTKIETQDRIKYK